MSRLVRSNRSCPDCSDPTGHAQIVQIQQILSRLFRSNRSCSDCSDPTGTVQMQQILSRLFKSNRSCPDCSDPAGHVQIVCMLMALSFPVQLLEGYGQTECHAICCLQLVGDNSIGELTVLPCPHSFAVYSRLSFLFFLSVSCFFLLLFVAMLWEGSCGFIFYHSTHPSMHRDILMLIRFTLNQLFCLKIVVLCNLEGVI